MKKIIYLKQIIIKRGHVIPYIQSSNSKKKKKRKKTKKSDIEELKKLRMLRIKKKKIKINANKIRKDEVI